MVPQSQWSASLPIPGAPSDSQEPVLAFAAGALHAVWTSNKTLYHASLVDGQWQTPQSVASGEQPALAAGIDGSLHCAFFHWFLGNCEIYYTHWDASWGWALPQLVSRTSGVSSHPTLSVAQDGRIYIVWADSTPGPTTIYWAQQQGGIWTNVPIPDAQGSRPALAVGPNGELYVAWQDRLAGGEPFEILAAIYHEGAWSTPEIVSDNPLHHSISPALAVNPHDGTCHLVWQEESGGIYAIRHAERLPGGWSPPVNVSNLSAGDARLPRVAAGPKGFIQVLWLQHGTLMHRSRPPERNASWWGEEVACSACTGVSSLAACVSPASGELHAVWSAYVESDQRRLYHTYRKALIRHMVFIPVVAGPG